MCLDLIVDIGISQSRALLTSREVPVSLYLQDYSLKNISGNIYKGRVENITESLKCAFVNIGEEKSGMLHFDDCTRTVKKGDEILVQVTREASGNKGPRLTMNLTIPSKSIVLIIDSKEINISRSITNKIRRKELSVLGKELTSKESLGVIFRTQCEGFDSSEIVEEYNQLKATWDNISKKWLYIKGEKLLFEASSFLNYLKREYINSSINNIYINREEEKDILEEYIKENNLNIKVFLPSESMEKIPLIKNAIDYSLERSFEFKDGGNIVFDETEALNIIDVNSAYQQKEASLEEVFLKTNINSIDKIVQIISLRNSSGIILIDFIDMKRKSSKEKVIEELYSKFREYNIKATIHGFTSLGILEISKAKKSRPLRPSVYVDGSNKIKRELYSIKNLENEIIYNLYKKNIKSFNIVVSESIYHEINEIGFISYMKDLYSVDIQLEKMKDFNEYYIEDKKEDKFARISIGKRNIIGEIVNLDEEDNYLSIKISKVKS